MDSFLLSLTQPYSAFARWLPALGCWLSCRYACPEVPDAADLTTINQSEIEAARGQTMRLLLEAYPPETYCPATAFVDDPALKSAVVSGQLQRPFHKIKKATA